METQGAGPRSTGGAPTGVLRSPEALLGLLGTAVVAVASTSPTFTTDGVGWGQPAIDAVGAELSAGAAGWGQFAGVCLVVAAWWRLRPARSGWTVGPLAAVLALWCLPLLLAPPVLSRDAVAYAEIGWLWHVGLDPYSAALGGHDGPFAAGIDPLWARPAVYPPVSVWVASVADAAAGYAPYWSLVAQRVVALLSVGVLAALVPGVARRLGGSGSGAFWWVVLSPLTVIHLVGGAHNDALLVALVVAAAYAALRWRDQWVVVWVVAPVLVGVATAVKPQALLAVAAVQCLPLVDELPTLGRMRALGLLAARGLAGGAVALATLAATHMLTGLGVGWVSALRDFPDVVTPAPSIVVRGLLVMVATAAGFDVQSVEVVTVALPLLAAVAAAVWLVWRCWSRPLLAAGGALAVLALGTTLVQPWHLALGLSLLGLERLRPSVGRVVALALAGYLLLYSLLIARPLSDVQLALLGLVMVGALVLVRALAGRGRRGGPVGERRKVDQ